MPDFLLEIGLEEVPARMIEDAEADLALRTVTMLERQQLLSEAVLTEGTASCVKRCSTPRRLAVLVHGVLEQQPDITEETTGPAVKIAFKDGQPTPAAEAFARKAGVPVEALKTITTPKGDYLAATTLKHGRTAAEVLAAELPKEIAAIYWPKSMYWREHKPERFVRPVLWLVCLLGEEIVPVTFAGRTAGRATYGHRVLHGDAPITITAPSTYLTQLESAYVLADVELRRQKIRKALDKVTREIPQSLVNQARWREDEALVDAVTHLTEWPDVLLGNFEPAYLELPPEILITVMRDHQKYFAVEDVLVARLAGDSPKLAPHFLTVTNIALNETNAAIIKQGNERVLRARFNDARFFWEFDQRTPLAARVELLKNVTFQKDLGTYADKTARIYELAGFLAGNAESRGAKIDTDALGTAVKLAKTDLTTELVKEFTELQGVIGGLYAEYQGLPKKVSDAIKDQYIPAGMEDGVPRTIEGALLGIADRADTIAGMFRLGMEPTGSKDPFALRRAGNGIIKILAETELPLTLAPIINHSVDGSELNVGKNDAIKEKMRAFLYERLEFYLREARGQAYDVVAAVMAPMRNIPNYGDIRDLIARAEAVTAVRGSEDFLAVSAAFKRMKNILAQAIEQGEDFTHVSGAAFVPIALEVLTKHAIQVRAEVNELGREGKYVPALQKIAMLRPDVDRVFSEVMILDKDPLVRRFNLASLHEIVAAISSIADFSEIVTLPTGISFAQTL